MTAPRVPITAAVPRSVALAPGGRFAELGVSGLEQHGGYVTEERLRALQGAAGMRVYRQMADGDATVGAILFAIEMILRRVDWRVEPATDAPADVELAEFVEECMHDMSHSWPAFVAEVVSMLTFGWAAHEIVYKTRGGPREARPENRSKYRDGRVGWRKLPLRAQETLDRWDFDEDGGVRGWWQQPPTGTGTIYLPIEKLLLFRTTSRKNNPEGRSALRTAYRAWYHKKEIERIEAIGIERDFAGLPVLYVEPGVLDPGADATTRATRAAYELLVKRLKNNEQAGLLLPSIFDEAGNQLVKFDLAGTGARRLFDTNAILSRYRQDIATSVLADVVLLGHEKVGSFALSDSKTHLLSVALGAWLDEIAEVMNRFAVPRLLALNGESLEELPRLQPGDLEKPELEKFAASIAQLTAAGWLTPGGADDERHVREKLDLPKTAAGFTSAPTGDTVPDDPSSPPPPSVPSPSEIADAPLAP